MQMHTNKTIFTLADVINLKAGVIGSTGAARSLQATARDMVTHSKAACQKEGTTYPGTYAPLLAQANSLFRAKEEGTSDRRHQHLAYGFMRNKTLKSMEPFSKTYPSLLAIMEFLPKPKGVSKDFKMHEVLGRWIEAQSVTINELLDSHNVSEQLVRARKDLSKMQAWHEYAQSQYSKAQNTLKNAKRSLQEREDKLVESNVKVKEAKTVVTEIEAKLAAQVAAKEAA